MALDPYDDSDVAQAEALLRMSVDERVEHVRAAVAFAEGMRAAYRDAGAATA